MLRRARSNVEMHSMNLEMCMSGYAVKCTMQRQRLIHVSTAQAPSTILILQDAAQNILGDCSLLDRLCVHIVGKHKKTANFGSVYRSAEYNLESPTLLFTSIVTGNKGDGYFRVGPWKACWQKPVLSTHTCMSSTILLGPNIIQLKGQSHAFKDQHILSIHAGQTASHKSL